MYKRRDQVWSKHLDFFLVDEISLQLAFIAAVFLRNQVFAHLSESYRNFGILLILIDALVLIVNNSMHNVLRRGYFKEAVATFKHCFIVFAIAAIYMFAVKAGIDYSRIALFLTFLFHILLGYGARLLWKLFLKKRGHDAVGKRAMLVVAAPETV